MNEAPRMLIDGDCGFCQASGELLLKLTKNRLVVEKWQSLALLPVGVTEAQLSQAVAFVKADGAVSWGARAISHALQMSPLFTAKLGGQLLGIFPISIVAEGIYRVVARNRHRLSRAIGRDACVIDHGVAVNRSAAREQGAVSKQSAASKQSATEATPGK